MMLVDIHCHLSHDQYKSDLDQVLERAKKAGVKVIVCSGVNVPTNREVLKMAEKYKPLVKCSLGIYPVDALGISGEEIGLTRQVVPIDVDQELEFIRSRKDEIVGIGEAGLDYQMVTEPELQKRMRENFQKVISFAEKIKLPIIVHSRKAESDCLDMLESSRLKKVVLHCFGGNKALIRRGAELGYYFSIPTIIERLQHFQTLAGIVNISQLLTETDGPWLAPKPRERNEPANVIYTIKQVARIKGFTEEETANSIFMNYERVFVR